MSTQVRNIDNLIREYYPINKYGNPIHPERVKIISEEYFLDEINKKSLIMIGEHHGIFWHFENEFKLIEWLSSKYKDKKNVCVGLEIPDYISWFQRIKVPWFLVWQKIYSRWDSPERDIDASVRIKKKINEVGLEKNIFVILTGRDHLTYPNSIPYYLLLSNLVPTLIIQEGYLEGRKIEKITDHCFRVLKKLFY